MSSLWVIVICNIDYGKICWKLAMWVGKVSDLQVLAVKSGAVVCRGTSQKIASQVRYCTTNSSLPKSALCNKDIPCFARREKMWKNSTRIRTRLFKWRGCKDLWRWRKVCDAGLMQFSNAESCTSMYRASEELISILAGKLRLPVLAAVFHYW